MIVEQRPKIPGLNKLDTMADFMAKKPLGLESRLCVRARYRQLECDKCTTVCTSGAISFSQRSTDPLEVDFTSCNGCGACVTACPTGVFDYTAGLTDFDLLKKAALSIKASPESQVVFACHRVDAEVRAKAIETVCLARLHETILVGVAKFEAEQVRLVSRACADCDFKEHAFIIERTAAAARLATVLGFKTAFKLVDEAEVAGLAGGPALIEKEQPTRRELFEGVVGFFKKTTVAWVDEKVAPLTRIGRQTREDKGFIYLVPAKRQMLLGLVKEIKVRGKATLPNLPIRDAVFDYDKCNFCGDCALFCPTTAVALEQHRDGDHLVFYAGYCVDCGLCEFACRPAALKLTETVKLAEFCRGQGRALKSAALKFECVLCGAQFAGSKPVAVCPTCYELQKLQGHSDEDIEMLEPTTIDGVAK